MDEKQAKRFGAYLRTQREARGMPTREVAKAAGLFQPTVVRIELGEFKNPDPEKIIAIAEAIGLDPAEALGRAGYPIPTDHLSPSVYLRAKFSNLPDVELDALQRDVLKVLKRHGVDQLDGPAPGEDEQPERTRRRTTTRTTKTKGGTS